MNSSMQVKVKTAQTLPTLAILSTKIEKAKEEKNSIVNANEMVVDENNTHCADVRKIIKDEEKEKGEEKEASGAQQSDEVEDMVVEVGIPSAGCSIIYR
ncbi:hypothetical protein JTB14_019918 [Gonioctena quinquepunctata]|nr:hypothetical protein JTB14_019918 [Gonioctena quinquepunctata]